MTNCRSIASEDTMGEINSLLLKSEDTKHKDSDECDAYGHYDLFDDKKMPAVKLPILGGFSLRAMSKESPCQCRYGMIDAMSFPVGNTIRKRTKSSLEWLADKENRGKTWSQSGTSELFFAFPETLPKIPLSLTEFLGDNSHYDGARFTDASKTLMESFKGMIQREKRDFYINVFAMRKMDKARTKVVFDRAYTAKNIIQAAKEWQDAYSNIPEIIWRQWGKNKGEIVEACPSDLYPLQVAVCVNHIWQQNGTSKTESKNMQAFNGLEILMNDIDFSKLKNLLSIVVRNGKGLLLYMVHEINKGHVLAGDKGKQIDKKRLPSILGLLLYKINIQKEQYMKDSPFLIGQLLKVSDEIHALYCKVVRRDDNPNQLLGNALMISALESPSQALAILAQRLNPYLGWAKTHRLKSPQKSQENDVFTSDKRAGWLVSLYEPIANELAEKSLPDRFSDAEKAQLLLGYLASHPKKEKSHEKEINND